MDPITLLIPGAQALVTAILSDTWKGVRTTFARLWAHDDERVGSVEKQLDKGREYALALPGGDEQSTSSPEVMQAYWMGFLAGMLAERPDKADALERFAAFSESAATNVNTGTVGKLLQAGGDVSGDVHFGG